MADDATLAFDSARPPLNDPAPVDFVRGLGRQLPRTAAPEGWVKKIDRRRVGRVWVGFFHLWTTDAHGRRVRKFKEKTLGPASMPKHDAQKKLADYIEEYTGRLTKQDRSITTFGELWTAFCAVKSGCWSKKTLEDLKYLFGKHVLPIVGNQPPRQVTFTSLQLLLNKLAADGYGETSVGRIRTYIKACFEYATDEDLVSKNPARKLEMPTIRKKVCERFLSLEEIGALLSEAAPREHLVLHILTACGLRPAEILVLRIEDFDGTKLRIDEALKDREKGEARIGRTKTKASDSSVPVPPDLSREIAAWIAAHPERTNPRAFLFPNRRETPYSVGNYLKRYLKPLAERVGIHDLTHQAFRRTSSTHIQDYASVKDLQGHLRHTNPQTTLKHYTKVIPEIPTAFSIIAIKQFTVCNRSDASEERIRLGVEMLLDRACVDGGWNSGNSVVYGVPLRPHVEATAVALLALQDEQRTEMIQKSLSWLRQNAASVDSVSSLAWCILSLFVYKEPIGGLKNRLAIIIGDGRDILNNATLATAILALKCGEMIHPFQVLR